MSELGGFICPFCRYYNAKDARVCARCEKRLPPPSLAGGVRDLMGVELWATKALAAVSIVMFGLELAASSKGAGSLNGMSGPMVIRFGGLATGLQTTEPYRLLAACFLHLGVLHVVMNMFSLANLGRIVEPQIGGARFVVSYVVTGIVGFVASVLWYGTSPYVTAGASGAIFGIEGILIGTLAVRRDPTWKAMLSNLIVNSAILAIAFPVNNSAHLGGFVSGLALGVLFQIEARPWRIGWLVNGLAAIAGVAIVLSLVLSYVSPTSRMIGEMQHRRAATVDGGDD